MWETRILALWMQTCRTSLGRSIFRRVGEAGFQKSEIESFQHSGRDLLAVVHGDDFVFMGLDCSRSIIRLRIVGNLEVVAMI